MTQTTVSENIGTHRIKIEHDTNSLVIKLDIFNNDTHESDVELALSVDEARSIALALTRAANDIDTE